MTQLIKVNNPAQLKRYSGFKEEFKKHNGSKHIHERFLWHGTGGNIPESVARNRLDVRYGGGQSHYKMVKKKRVPDRFLRDFYWGNPAYLFIKQDGWQRIPGHVTDHDSADSVYSNDTMLRQLHCTCYVPK